jgi:alpha-D-ribose 1-methylphosphonate 5-triphosphate synthase subunit PhnL
MTPVLDVRGVHKCFTLHLRDGLRLPVLDSMNLQVNAGECVALVGPSGRGKSTLMKCLYGSYAVDSGAMWLQPSAGGRIDMAQAGSREMLALRRREIAYVSQFLRVLPRQPALDVVAERLLVADPADPETDADPLDDTPYLAVLEAARARARTLLARLNLPAGLWDLPPATFSGGEQQRVNVARGFVVPSTLLLLDEPTASLDAANRRVVVELIHEAKAAGTAVVGIFHDEEVRDAVADRQVDFSSHFSTPSSSQGQA